MTKKIVFILSIIVLQIHAMEKPMEIEKSTPFFLALLPIDTQNLIAQFLTFDDIETEEEFITRTKIKTIRIPKPYDKHLPRNEWGSGSNGTLIGYCPNEINVALLRLLSGTGATPALTIINEKKDQLLYQVPLDHGNYQHIALSRCANIFATIQSEKDSPKDIYAEVMHHKKILTIQKISSQATQIITIPDYFEYKLIAFKKEGTHIILQGRDSRSNYRPSYKEEFLQKKVKQQPVPHHMLIPITINEQHPEPSTKTLQHYFERKLVCRNLKNKPE